MEKEKSFLPQIKVKPDARGTAIQDNTDSWASVILLFVLTILFGGVPFYFLFIVKSGLISFEGIFIIVFGFFGLLLLYGFCKQLIEKLSFAAGVLIVPTWPLEVGHKARLYFSRGVKGSTSVNRIEGKIWLAEEATYQVGTDSRTEKETIWEHKLPDVQVSSFAGNKLETEWELDLPSDLPATFAARRNKIRWLVAIKLFRNDQEIADSDFEVIVKA